MRQVAPIPLAEGLIEWGVHECRGRLSQQLPTEVKQSLEGDDSSFHALIVILHCRPQIVAAILMAEVNECLRVEITAEDIDRVFVMGPSPLTEHASSLVGQSTEHAIHVERLVGRGRIEGPFLGVARPDCARITILDGIHRADAWALQLARGDRYPLVLNVVCTRNPTRYE